MQIKPQWDNYTPRWMDKSEKIDIAKGLVRMLGSQKNNKLFVGVLTELSFKVKRNLHNDPTIAFLSIYPIKMKIYIHKKTCTGMFIEIYS